MKYDAIYCGQERYDAGLFQVKVGSEVCCGLMLRHVMSVDISSDAM